MRTFQYTFFLIFNLVTQSWGDFGKNNPIEHAKDKQTGGNARGDIRIDRRLLVWRIPDHCDDEDVEHDVEDCEHINDFPGLENRRDPF